MSEAGKVRIVRCPNCENLLPEVAEYSVYQCGGCGAVLRAKNKGVDLDMFSNKSDEEKATNNVKKVTEKCEKMNVSEKRVMESSDGSESDVRSSISYSSRGERTRILRDRVPNYSSRSMNEEGSWEGEDDDILDKKSDQLQHAKIAQDFGDLRVYNDHEDLGVPKKLVDGRNPEKSEMMKYVEEGSSSYDYENPTRNKSNLDRFNNLGEDREELLKRLDELKDKLSHSGNSLEKGKQKVPLDPRMARQDPYASRKWYHDTSMGMNKVSGQYSSDTQFHNSPYQSQYAEPSPFIQREERGNGFYPPPHAPTHTNRYGDPLTSHMPRRVLQQTPPNQQPPYYNSGSYMDDSMVYAGNMEPYPLNVERHHFSCSCYYCRNMRLAPLPSDNYSDFQSDAMFNYRVSGDSFGSREYSNGLPNPPLRTCNTHLHTRWPSDMTSEIEGFIGRRPHRAHLASSRQLCRPLAGGAPFLTCYNCFELLFLPAKTSTKSKKVRCGACSAMIVFAISSKNLVVSVDGKHDILTTQEDTQRKQVRTTFSSNDYDDYGYDFQSIDRESGSKAHEMENRNSTSTFNSEAEEDWENSTALRKDIDSADLAMNDKGPRPPMRSLDHMAKRFGDGNRSGRSELDKELPNKIATLRSNESSATEIDLSSNEYFNTGTTPGSSEGSKEGDRLKGSRVADSFFAGIIKKSFKDSNKSNHNAEQEKANVTVNGHLIPDRLIKKAQKLAGPIYPGNYWYDFRAGFWGSMGGPCLGIIPPFIEEFNYPVPEHCSGGSTHVFVNGRELNQKDLNLLATRGLPTDSNRSYIVEISGRVLDEDTGEELESLGKLAPTVEKAKRGFGMRDPNGVAR